MNTRLLALLALLAVSTSAVGLFDAVHRLMTTEQLDAAHKVISDSLDLPKKTVRKNLADFVATMPKNVQDLIKKERIRINNEVKKSGEKVKKLSKGAQKVYKQLADLRKDESVSVRQLLKKMEKIIEKADPKVTKEMHDAKIFGVEHSHDFFFTIN